MHENIIVKLMEIHQQFRILHWETKSYSRHKAYDMVYEELDDLIDKFAECLMGKYGAIKLSNEKIKLVGAQDLDINKFLNDIKNFLISLSDTFDPKIDSDLLNIRDEILALQNKLRYLLTLR